MQNQLFRKSSIQRISSPEQLQDYMKAANPGVWMVLAAVIALLAGIIIASATGTLETTMTARGEVSDAEEAIALTLPADKGAAVKAGMTVRVAGSTGRVEYVYEDDGEIGASAVLDDPEIDLPEGVYDVEIVLESIRPISFLLN